MTDLRAARRPWTVLAYTIAEDTNTSSPLDESAQGELRAICDAADFGRVSVAAQVDFRQRRGVFRGAVRQLQPEGRGGFKNIRPDSQALWMQIKEAADAGTADLHLQRDQTDLNAARADVLSDFLKFGRTECPADRYVVSFFGHAAGPLGIFHDKASRDRDYGLMRLNDLASALRGKGTRADVVIFRDCYMNCLEAAYQLRHVTPFMIATQALAPATGTWPWADFMRVIGEAETPPDVALGLAKALAAFLDVPGNRSGFHAVPYSLLELEGVEAVAPALEAIVEALEAARGDPARRRACAAALEGARVGSAEDPHLPGDPALLDVPTMCEGLAALTGDPVAAPAAALGEIVSTQLVRFHHSQIPQHRGTSLFYKPVQANDLRRSYLQAEDEATSAVDAETYRALGLSKATGWHRIALNPLPLD